MKKVLSIVIPVLVCILVGSTAGFLQADSIVSWYQLLHKSPLTPPNIVFPVVWSILYLGMGLSAGLILLSQDSRKGVVIFLFCLQLLFNFLWSILFFYFHNPLLGLIDLLILDVVAVAYAIHSYPLRKASSVLFIPYIIWILFATYLNAYILFYN